MHSAIAFDKVSLSTAWAITRNTADGDGYSTAWKYLMVIPVLAYILLFPTFMSLMTGYQAGLVPLVRLPDGNYMNASSLMVPRVLVIDGSRIGLTDMIASTPGDSWSQIVYDYQTTYNNFLEAVNTMVSHRSGKLETRCFNASNNQYNSDSCYFTALPTATRGDDRAGCYYGWTADDCARVQYWSATFNSTITVSGKTWDLKDSLLSVALHGGFNGTNYGTSDYVAERYFSTGSMGFNSTYLSATSQCQPASTYIWGFSFLMLFTVALLSAGFALVLSLICLDSYWFSSADRYEQHISMYRDILDMAEEIRDRLGAESKNLTSKELDRQMKEDKHSLRLRTDLLLPSRFGQAVKDREESILPTQRVAGGPRYAAVSGREHG